MSTAKHTPGPWFAEANDSYWDVNPANAGDNGIPFSVANVCSSEPGNRDGGLQEANARLIAAAPELLEACRKALYALKGREHDQFIRDAIANATGEQS